MSDTIEIGLASGDRERIARGLTRVLADSYTLYLMTHNFHWNVTGPRFRDLHLAFEEQYTELALAVDAIAERIRALGHPAPGTYSAFSQLSSIDEPEGVPAAEDMVRDLVSAHETLIAGLRAALPSAQDAGDESTVSLLSDRLVIHEKTAWMLRSSI